MSGLDATVTHGALPPTFEGTNQHPGGPEEPGRSRSPLVIVAVAVSSVALIGMGFLVWFFLLGGQGSTAAVPASTQRASDAVPSRIPVESATPSGDETETMASPTTTASEAPADSETPAAPAPVEAESATVNPQEVARVEMEQMRTAALDSLTLDGRWVAVLSTKKDGIEDLSQTAANGSHIFYYADILSLHNDLDSLFGGQANVLLVKTSDFGKQPSSGAVFWRTIADAGFSSEDDVITWCNSYFSGTEEEIENACLPKELVAPTQ